MRRALLVSVSCAALACSKEPPPAPTAPAPTNVASATRALGVDAAALETPIDPPAPVGDLRGDIERFDTIDACVSQRAQLDPLVGDALSAIGYETFLRDACRTLEAAKRMDVRRCEPIDATPLRDRCTMLVAVLARDPDQCPWFASSRPALGREPACLAVASRDARLCAAVDVSDRPTCEALAARDERRCDKVLSEGEKALCRRELARWSSVLPEAAEARPDLASPWGKLTVHPAEGSKEIAQTEVDLGPMLARGLVVVEMRDGAHVDVGTARETSVTAFVPQPAEPPSLAVTLILGSKPNDVKVDACELAVPGVATLVSPPMSCDLVATIEKLDRARGGDAKLTLRGTIGSKPKKYEVEVSLATFVRDVVKPGAIKPR